MCVSSLNSFTLIDPSRRTTDQVHTKAFATLSYANNLISVLGYHHLHLSLHHLLDVCIHPVEVLHELLCMGLLHDC